VSASTAVEDVFAYVTRVDTMPAWRGDIAVAEQLTEGPLTVGSRIRAGVRVPGRSIGLVIEVTAWEPGASFAFRPVSGPLRTHITHRFAGMDGGTQLTWTEEIKLSGILRPFGPVLAHIVRRQYAATLTRLKAILEA
jgi:ligand-binding SRPBCC domain-containing protein